MMQTIRSSSAWKMTSAGALALLDMWGVRPELFAPALAMAGVGLPARKTSDRGAPAPALSDAGFSEYVR